MVKHSGNAARELANIGVPLFWPMAAAVRLVEQGVELYAKILEFLGEEECRSAAVGHESGSPRASRFCLARRARHVSGSTGLERAASPAIS